MTSHRNQCVLTMIAMLIVTLLVGCAQPTATPIPPASTATPVAAATVEPAATEAPAELSSQADELILATTTSTENSGLLQAILPNFEAKYNATVSVIAVGTGQALALGEDGNADVLLVHARPREDAFMADGHGTRREDVMYNDFVIVGPADDPAAIKGMKKAPKALAKLAESKATFVSRGDDSGTHTKEKQIWTEAGLEPGGAWYVSAGQGMGAVLTMADEQQAYTLSDRATYLARTLEGTELVILVEGDPILFNPYGVMTVNPSKGDHIKADLANQFVDWIISVDTQELIGEFGVAEFGAPLFTPDSQPWRNTPAAAGALTINGVAFTEDQIRSLPEIEVVAKNNSGADESYKGHSILALLKLANVTGKTLTLVADDGNSAKVAMADLNEDDILRFRNNGGLSATLPDLPQNAWVKGVVALNVAGKAVALEGGELLLATTTSTENSGLLQAILPDFEAKYNATVSVIAVGTGQALTLGEDGNADVLLVHARAREDAFMADGHGTRREDVMYNDFVIVGPADDPAGIQGMDKAPEALAKLAEAKATFVSRGDDSGTHTKEKAIWADAGVEPGGDWYVSAGQGMGAVLTMADEQMAYTLSDRATYLARTLEGTQLAILVEGDPILFNPYGVMTVNPNKGDHIKADLANQFVDWLISVDTQKLIGEFGVAEFGAPLFTPDSQPWRDSQ